MAEEFISQANSTEQIKTPPGQTSSEAFAAQFTEDSQNQLTPSLNRLATGKKSPEEMHALVEHEIRVMKQERESGKRATHYVAPEQVDKNTLSEQSDAQLVEMYTGLQNWVEKNSSVRGDSEQQEGASRHAQDIFIDLWEEFEKRGADDKTRVFLATNTYGELAQGRGVGAQARLRGQDREQEARKALPSIDDLVKDLRKEVADLEFDRRDREYTAGITATVPIEQDIINEIATTDVLELVEKLNEYERFDLLEDYSEALRKMGKRLYKPEGQNKISFQVNQGAPTPTVVEKTALEWRQELNKKVGDMLVEHEKEINPINQLVVGRLQSIAGETLYAQYFATVPQGTQPRSKQEFFENEVKKSKKVEELIDVIVGTGDEFTLNNTQRVLRDSARDIDNAANIDLTFGPETRNAKEWKLYLDEKVHNALKEIQKQKVVAPLVTIIQYEIPKDAAELYYPKYRQEKMDLGEVPLSLQDYIVQEIKNPKSMQELLSILREGKASQRLHYYRDGLNEIRKDLRKLDNAKAEHQVAQNWYDNVGNAITQIENEEHKFAYSMREFQELLGEAYEGEKAETFFTNRELRDKVFDDIFSAADVSPQEQFEKVMSPFTKSGRRLDHFMDFMRNANIGVIPKWVNLSPAQWTAAQNELVEDFQRYTHQREIRGIMHDFNTVIYSPSIKMENIVGFAQRLESNMVDSINKMEGIEEMKNCIEMAMREVMAANNGYLPPTAMTGETEEIDGITIFKKGEVEIRATEIYNFMYAKARIYTRNSSTADTRTVQPGKENWTTDRIFGMARGMMVAEGGMLSLAAESTIPPEGSYTSLFLQDIIGTMAGFVHLIAKYDLSEDQLALLMHNNDFMSPEMLRHAYEEYKEDNVAFLQGLTNPENERIASIVKDFFINQLNPNMCGDIYTYASWRFGSDPEKISMITEFAEKGQKRMFERLQARFGTDVLPGELKDYYGLNPAIFQDPQLQTPILVIDDDYIYYKDDIMDEKHTKKHHGRNKMLDPRKGRTDKQAVLVRNIWLALKGKIETNPNNLNLAQFIQTDDYGNPRELTLSEVRTYLTEHKNWIGTGLRLELMRGDIDKGKKDKVTSAKALLSHVAQIQPHRLFTTSRYTATRYRLDEKYDPNSDDTKRILKNTALAEQIFLEQRENFLANGHTFNTIDYLNPDFYKDPKNRWFLQELQNQQTGLSANDLNEVFDFAQFVQEDFTANQEDYFTEWIYKRNVYHGYAAWRGDIPMREFKLALVGPNGSLARRMRDNEHQGKAVMAQLELMNHLSKIKTVEDLYEPLGKIFEEVAGYDAGKAKLVMEPLLQGLCNFYGANELSQIPGIGMIYKLNFLNIAKGSKGLSESFSQFAYGTDAMVMNLLHKRTLLKYAYDQNWLTKEGYNRLKETTRSSDAKTIGNYSVLIGQMIAFGLLMHMLKETTAA